MVEEGFNKKIQDKKIRLTALISTHIRQASIISIPILHMSSVFYNLSYLTPSLFLLAPYPLTHSFMDVDSTVQSVLDVYAGILISCKIQVVPL